MKKYQTNSSFYSDEIDKQSYPKYNPNIYTTEDDYYDDYEEYMGNDDEDSEESMEKDFQSIKKMYPELCKKIQKYIEEECDRLDYEGSAMYDEEMDKELVEIIIDRIYERLISDPNKTRSLQSLDEELGGMNYNQNYGHRDTIKVMLLNNMYNRRCRRYYRRGRRCWQRPYPRKPYYPCRSGRCPYPMYRCYPGQRNRPYR